ncbi:hypothetical protein L6Q96_22625 [Candidatus Binatia bacterium]|nr:hypothetical protein [Candidatus Binatia bacterium]
MTFPFLLLAESSAELRQIISGSGKEFFAHPANLRHDRIFPAFLLLW